MTEHGVLAALKSLGGVLLWPILATIGYLYTRQVKRIDYLEHKVNEQEKINAVLMSQMQDVKDDIKGIGKKLDKIEELIRQLK